MFKSISNWWNRDKIRQQELESMLLRLEDKLTEKTNTLADVNDTLIQTEEELAEFKAKEAEEEARRAGTEPWVEIKSAVIDPVKGIQIELDWNAAFVQYLRDNGMTGQDDETIVQKWLAFLYEDLVNRLEDQVINTTDHGTVNGVL